MQQRKRGDNVEENEELVERIPAHADGYLSPLAHRLGARATHDWTHENTVEML